MNEYKIVRRKDIEKDIKTIIKRAKEDETFSKEFINNPKKVFEKELGLKFEDDVKITVHKEALKEVHIVLPATSIKKSDVEGQGINGGYGLPPYISGIRG